MKETTPEADKRPRIPLSCRPMPAAKRTRRSTYHHGDLARALAAAAVELAAEGEAFTLREVAAKVGVAHSAAYRHYPDKRALLAAVAEEGFRELFAHVARRAVAAGDDARARLSEIAMSYVDFALERPGHYAIMFGPRLNRDGRFPALEAAISEVAQLVADEIKRGQAQGQVREGRARDIGLSLWVFAHGYVELVQHRRVKVKDRAVAADYFLALLEPLLDGLTLTGSRSAPPTRARRS